MNELATLTQSEESLAAELATLKAEIELLEFECNTRGDSNKWRRLTQLNADRNNLEDRILRARRAKAAEQAQTPKAELNTELIAGYIEKVEAALERNLKSLRHKPETEREIDATLKQFVPPILAEVARVRLAKEQQKLKTQLHKSCHGWVRYLIFNSVSSVRESANQLRALTDHSTLVEASQNAIEFWRNEA